MEYKMNNGKNMADEKRIQLERLINSLRNEAKEKQPEMLEAIEKALSFARSYEFSKAISLIASIEKRLEGVDER